MSAGIIGDLAKWFGRSEIEEISADDTGVVCFVVDFACGQVQCGQVRGVKGDVATEKFANKVNMRPVLVDMAFSIVGADKETARSAGGIEDRVGGIADTEAINKIHDVIAGKMLAETVPLLRADKFLEDTSHDVGRNFAKVH